MKKVIGLLALLVFMTACLNDFLEIKPLDTPSTENFWKTENDVRAALNAAYVPLRDAYLNGFLRCFEARSDNFLGASGGSDPFQEICFNKLTSSMPAADWNNWYTMISVANYAIYYIPGIENIAIGTRNHLLSEAYFIRAFAYFNIYRIWGDAPLISKPVLTQSDVEKPVKSSKDEIMNLIKGDLKEAVKVVDNSQQEIFIYSPGALYALCTDVSMWNNDYEAAVFYSQKLLDLNVYTLEGVDFRDVCAKANTKDNIWTMKWIYTQDGINSIVSNYMNSGNLLIPTKEIYDKWKIWGGSLDKRRVITLDTLRVSEYRSNHVKRLPNGCHIWKWSPGEKLDQKAYQECYIPIYRLADILLLRAEALVKQKDYSGAILEINKVRRRAGIPERTFDEYNVTGEINVRKLEEDILQERQFELYAEGKRWFDLRRTGLVEEVMNTFYDGYIKSYGGIGYHIYTEEWQQLWPVSQNILNENDNLVQTGEY